MPKKGRAPENDKNCKRKTKRTEAEWAKLARESLNYDPDTGTLTWKTAAGCVKKGAAAGCRHGEGYLTVGLGGVTHLSHRVAWLIARGTWPSKWLDHKDGDRANNRMDNLREATPSENSANAKVQCRNKLGVRGVSLHKKAGKYSAEVAFRGKKVKLGLFTTVADAKAARDAVAVQMHGQFFNHGGAR